MAISTAQVTVGATAVEVTITDTGGSFESSITVRPVADIYVGNSGVTTSNGYSVAAGSSLSLDLTAGERLYAVAASGSTTVYVLRSDV